MTRSQLSTIRQRAALLLLPPRCAAGDTLFHLKYDFETMVEQTSHHEMSHERPFAEIITLDPLEKREFKQPVSLSHLINQGLNYLNPVPFNEKPLDMVSGILLRIIQSYMYLPELCFQTNKWPEGNIWSSITFGDPCWLLQEKGRLTPGHADHRYIPSCKLTIR